jgi:hypothetical protein
MTTDNEIIKALECCINADCLNCPNWSKEWYRGMCNDFLRSVLGLINNLKAENEDLEIKLKHFAEFLAEAEKKNEALISAQETLQKHIESKNSVIERLRHANKCAIEALSVEYGILLERKNAEIERLEAENKALHRLLDAKGE